MDIGKNEKGVPAVRVVRSWCQLLIFLSVSLILESARRHFTREYEFASSLDIARGYAEVPYQYRFIIAWICLRLSELLPALSFYSYLFVADVFAGLITLWSSRVILESSGFSPLASFWLAVFVAVPLAVGFLGSPQTSHSFYYPSDFAAVAFFTLGILLLYKRKQILFELLFLVGILNRESILFLLFPYLRIFVAGDTVRIWSHLRFAFLLAAFAIIKLLIAQAYSLNPGHAVHFSLINNFEWLIRDYHIFSLFALAGGLCVPMLLIVRYIPSAIKDLLACIMPLSVIMVLVGGIGEFRIFLEIIPLLWVSVAIGIKCFHVDWKGNKLKGELWRRSALSW